MSAEREALLDIRKTLMSGSYFDKSEMVDILEKRDLLKSVTYSCPCGQDTVYGHIPLVPTCSSCGEIYYITLKDFSI